MEQEEIQEDTREEEIREVLGDIREEEEIREVPGLQKDLREKDEIREVLEENQEKLGLQEVERLPTASAAPRSAHVRPASVMWFGMFIKDG